MARDSEEHSETIRRVQHWKGRRWDNERGELQTAFPVTSHQKSSGAGKAPAAPLLESHLQPSSKSEAAVAAWGPTGVLGKEQEELAAGGISSI